MLSLASSGKRSRFFGILFRFGSDPADICAGAGKMS